jgi:hypothetical protein
MRRMITVLVRQSRGRHYLLAAVAKSVQSLGKSTIKVGLMSAATLSVSMLVLSATPASAAIVKPSSGSYVVKLDAKGNPIPFTVEASGYAADEPVYLEICDGVPASEAGWSPTIDCDGTTSGAAVAANGRGVATFAVGSQSEVLLFRGASPTRSFNCVASADMDRSATPATGMGDVVLAARQSYPPAGDEGYSADEPTPLAADPTIPSWSDCQVRIASTNEVATADQQFVRFSLGGRPSLASHASKKSTALPYASVVVPLGAAIVIAGGGLVYTRRRRHARLSV